GALPVVFPRLAGVQLPKPFSLLIQGPRICWGNQTMKIISLALLLIVSACAVFAQGALGTITGQVTDPSGAVVGNASIEVKNTATGVVVKTVSTATGNYTAPQLQVGAYDLTVTVSGFKTYKRSGLDLA